MSQKTEELTELSSSDFSDIEENDSSTSKEVTNVGTTKIEDENNFAELFGEISEKEEGENSYHANGDTNGIVSPLVEIPEEIQKKYIFHKKPDLFSQERLYSSNLPNFVFTQTEEFSRDSYRPISLEDCSKETETKQDILQQTMNTIRWRSILEQDGNIKRESNSRIVKWSDGTMTLMIGDEAFIMDRIDYSSGNQYIYRQDHEQEMMQAQRKIDEKITIRHSGASSSTYKRLILASSEKNIKKPKVLQYHSNKDPEFFLKEMAKAQNQKDKIKRKHDTMEKHSKKSRRNGEFDEDMLEDSE